MKKTKWFPGRLEPELSGVYERRIPGGYGPFAYWNGKYWGGFAATPAVALANRTFESSFQYAPWRGLADPSDAS